MKILVLDAATFLQERLLEGKNIRVKFLTCGKQRCACRLGRRHGPYYYVRKKIGNRYVDEYLSTGFKTSWSLNYQVVGNSVLLEVKTPNDIPEQLRQFPTFEILSRVS